MRLSACNTDKLASVKVSLDGSVTSVAVEEPSVEMGPSATAKPGRGYRFVSGPEAAEIVLLYESGLSAAAMGRQVVRYPRTATDTLRRHGDCDSTRQRDYVRTSYIYGWPNSASASTKSSARQLTFSDSVRCPLESRSVQ